MPRLAAAPQDLSADKVAQLLAAARERPQLADIPWHDDEAVFDGPPVLREDARGTPAADAGAAFADPVRRRIRDRYISVRFAGVARGAADLENPTRVIKAAWLCFEERHGEAALELLRLACAQNPMESLLHVAQLDLAWRLRDRERFVQAARAFHGLFPRSAEWPELMRLGRDLAPDEVLFAQSRIAGRVEAGGTPRWLQPPWEVAPPLEAAEFHRAMVAEAADGR